eukprot:CAMPEP_0201899148 /NCGR_PEP_ID=MMETSP0902-20130614/49818_1 /ASSEMBLY_ACC=CAM_ASM_000551 /TAXON_ID=420261 /ORGANISM="Thalassiosira antarctica, Strain CCMP982" /LENGTH=257 /DNA_ID=CAMNT_0048432477 /DNA_START=32 /DNA_END=802 /DNA_ORIENTATION=+
MPSFNGNIALTCATFICGLVFLPHSMGYSILPHQHGSGSSSRAAATTSDIPLEQYPTPIQRNQKENRRGFLTSVIEQTTFLSFLSLSATTANAFENRLDDKYADAIATTGAQPKDLGVATRKSRTEGSYVGLKACGNSPNCLASSNPKTDLPVRTISGWNGGSIKDVKKVIDTYQVGHNDIDGGGFKVMEYDEKEKYLYVQFQSYQAGYIDDFECWFNPKSGRFDVRSSSRVGYSDFGVNNLRLEYIAGRLEKEFKW